MRLFRPAIGWLLLTCTILSCKNESSNKSFTVSGTIRNLSAGRIYLEEIPVATMQRFIVDSTNLGKDGSFTLKTKMREAAVYNLRRDIGSYPLAWLINDNPTIEVNILFNKADDLLPESYEVKGSESSTMIKDFMKGFDTKLQPVLKNDGYVDSLEKQGGSDSLVNEMKNERITVMRELSNMAEDFIHRSKNPALTMFILGYYQATANAPGIGLTPYTDEEVGEIVSDISKRFPAHKGLAAIKRSIDANISKAKNLVGQMAPEISLPDVNGKIVSLSSFRGKYVLVDFWASWCNPCREENPNVVRAYNKFRGKNFAILGVSLDKPGERDEWIKAIKADKLSWTHVSELMYWNSTVVSLYQIESIPFNVLVDPTGKIIGQELFGIQLETKLQEVLK